MTSPGPPHRDRRSAFLLVGALAFLVYLNALPNGYAFDDVAIIANNPGIHALRDLPAAMAEPYWPGTSSTALGLWRPTTTGVLGLLWSVGEGAPLVFHAANVAGHVAASVLVLALLSALLSLPAALVGALVFAVHPVHVEAVANGVGLAELLASLAILGACLVHLRAGVITHWGRALVIGLLYAIGFGAKESAITLPALLFLLDAGRARLAATDLPAHLWARSRAYVVMAGVAAALLAARFAILGSVASPDAPKGGALLLEIPKIWTLGEIWLHYVRLWVFPLDLVADYSPRVVSVSLGWGPANTAGVVVTLGILLLALLSWRHAPLRRGEESPRAVGFGVVWFLIAISPLANVVFLTGVFLAERTLYLPSVGLAAATGWAVVRLGRDRPRLAWTGLVVALALLGARTWLRNPTWRDNPTMLATLIGDYPQSGRSQWLLGDAFLEQGRVSEGLRAYRAAIGLLGADYALITEITRRLMRAGDYRSAERMARFAVLDRPDEQTAWAQLAFLRAEVADAPETERYARRALALRPFDPVRHHLLAWSLAAQDRIEEAEAARRIADAQGPTLLWQQYLYRAYARRAAGDTVAMRASVDSAWARTETSEARTALNSVMVSEFGLASRLTGADSAGTGGNR